MTTGNPYRGKPVRAFWRTAVADRHCTDLSDLWEPIALTAADRIATAGSCFAQHIGNRLARRGAAFMDMEPAPPVFQSIEAARRFGYGVFSCRYGNIYTPRQLLQLFDEAYGARRVEEIVWEKGGRFFDALRPGVTPAGHSSPDIVLDLRRRHLEAVRRMFEELDVFVFTLGLTEGWEGRSDGTLYPVAAGTVAGRHDPERYVFRNLGYGEIAGDMTAFWSRLKSVNPGARMLLTVSPVPLAATASDDHVLVATTYSKSLLRAVAGELAAGHEDIAYFPAYELIASPPFRGMFFDPDQRTVNASGVDHVMKHFFSGRIADAFPAGQDAGSGDLDLFCDEEALEPPATSRLRAAADRNGIAR